MEQEKILFDYKRNITVSQSKINQLNRFVHFFRIIYSNWLHKKINEPVTLSKHTLFVTGSYLSDTMLPFSDVDLLFLSPPSIDFNTFAEEFIPHLKKQIFLKCHVSIQHVEKRFNSFLPSLVRFECSPFLFDCSLSNIPYETLQMVSIHDPFFEKVPSVTCDNPSMIAFNSVRSLSKILRLVPSNRFELWKTFTQYISLWAKRKNICSNSTGFLSSISLSIMTVKIMQIKFKTKYVWQLMAAFFRIFNKWDWQRDIVDISNQKIETWSKHPDDVMTVLLPTNPKLNTCRNVLLTSLNVFKNELNIAHNEFQAFIQKKATHSCVERLYVRRGFFDYYQTFVTIEYKNFSFPSREKLSGIRYCIKNFLVYLNQHYSRLFKCAEIYEKPIYVNKNKDGKKNDDKFILFFIGILDKKCKQTTTMVKKRDALFVTILHLKDKLNMYQKSAHIIGEFKIETSDIWTDNRIAHFREREQMNRKKHVLSI